MLDLEFMRLALATGAVVGLLAPAVGFFLVERKASLIGDGLGHVAFAGVAFGYLLGISPVLTALVAAVIGAHSHTVGRHTGHVPLAVASSTDKPVIAVPPFATPPPRLRRVMIAIEGTRRKAKELRRAIELIEAGGLEIIVVHVDDEANIPSFNDQVQHETEAYTNEFFARFLPGAPQARLELRIGTAADEILAATEEAEAELLAIGWPPSAHGQRGIVARELLERSQIPMLLVATR